MRASCAGFSLTKQEIVRTSHSAITTVIIAGKVELTKFGRGLALAVLGFGQEFR
jgi:hypothetical protein